MINHENLKTMYVLGKVQIHNSFVVVFEPVFLVQKGAFRAVRILKD